MESLYQRVCDILLSVHIRSSEILVLVARRWRKKGTALIKKAMKV